MAQVHHLQCDVTESEPLGHDHHRLVLRAPRIAAAARPGQFVHCAPGHPHESLAMLRRPLSIAGVLGEAVKAPDSIELIFRAVGPGTRILAGRRQHDKVDCLGPLGNGFTLAPKAISVVIAGGMGLVPLRWLARELAAIGSEVHLLIGARSWDDLPLHPQSVANATGIGGDGVLSEVVCEDRGEGLVTQLLARRLPSLLAAGRPIRVYAVGPRGMLRALTDVLPPEIPCQVSLEERMACGIGACRSCVVALRHPSPPGHVYRRVCKDGPVFELADIAWEAEKE